MKKIILSLSVLLFSLASLAQYPAGLQTIGNDSNVVKARGGFTAGTIYIPSFTDTTAANAASYVKSYNGSVIRVGTDFYMRANGGWYQFAAKVAAFTPGSIPFANALGILDQDNTGLSYDGNNLTVGHSGFSNTVGLYINGGRANILADGFGMTLGMNGGTPVDPSKSMKFLNSQYKYGQFLTTGSVGTWKHYFDLFTNFRIRGMSTDSTAPVTTGITKMVVTDQFGQFSWAAIPGASSAWSSITGTPTTIAGYGITDAAPLASPSFTGIPIAPTATGGTNTTQLATTAFVNTAITALPKDTVFVQNNILRVDPTASGKDSISLQPQTQNKFIASTIGAGSQPMTARVLVLNDLPFTLGTNLSYTGNVLNAAGGGSGLLAANFIFNEQFTGSTASSYTLANTPVIGKLSVFKNGMLVTDYTLAGAVVTLGSARLATDIFTNNYIK